MGACATKPKVDATEAPAPLPEKDVVVKKEIEGAAENAETQPELVKEEACAAEKKDDISESKTTPEVVKSEKSVETTSTPTVDAAEVKAEKATEVEGATEVEVEKEIEVTPAEEQAKDVETQKTATDVVDEKSVEAEKCEPKTEEKAVTETQ